MNRLTEIGFSKAGQWRLEGDDLVFPAGSANLSEGSAWEQEGMISLERKEPDLTIAGGSPSAPAAASTALLASPTANSTEQLDADELELRKQRRHRDLRANPRSHRLRF